MTRVRKIQTKTQGKQGLILHPNSEAIRTKTIKAYRAQITALRKANEKIRQFVEIDQPAFSLWWQQQFSEELHNRIELEKSYEELQLLADSIEQYRDHYRTSFPEAHEIVSKAHNSGTLGELMRAVFEQIDKSRAGHRKKVSETFGEDFFQSIFEDYEAREAKGHPNKYESRLQTDSDSASASTSEGYLKKIYHDLVLRLHPDAKNGAEQSAEDKILWHELQNAYQWKDLERLETIAKAVFGKASIAINFKTIPIGDIFAMKEALAKNLRDVNRELRQARREPTWDFENKRKKKGFLQHLSESIEEELLEHSSMLEYRIDAVRDQLKAWSRPPHRARSKNRS